MKTKSITVECNVKRIKGLWIFSQGTVLSELLSEKGKRKQAKRKIKWKKIALKKTVRRKTHYW